MNMGKLIVIEGTDCSGKETQSKRLSDRLWKDGFINKLCSFPAYNSPAGNIIKRYLGKPPYQQEFGPCDDIAPKIASTWYALDRKDAAEGIMYNLGNGYHVICNRYAESNMAHQGGKIKDAREREELIKWLEELEYESLKIPRADLVIFLHMPHQVAEELRKSRGGDADGHERNPEHLRNAEKVYLELADKFKWQRVDCAPDGTRASLKTIEQIGDEVYHIARTALQNT